MVIAEAVDSILLRQFRLRLPCVGQPQIVKTEVRWNMRLIMSRKKRPRLRDVAPLRKSLPPPLVVLGDGVELRKVEGDRSQVWRAALLRLLRIHVSSSSACRKRQSKCDFRAIGTSL